VWSLELLLGAALVGALTCYLLFGGADLGAGIWSLFAPGPHEREQRALIDRAIGPIWEANHVWLILAVTLLFTAFPAAFALIMTALHIPLSLMLVGIVLRGTAFAVRTQDVASRTDGGSTTAAIWRQLFAWSSLLTPGLLGISLGAIASGSLVGAQGGFTDRFLWPWFAPFPLSVGLLTTALVAYLAAVYLLVESEQPELQASFRRRALGSWFLVVLSAGYALFEARHGAVEIYQGLTGTWLGWTVLLTTGVVKCAAWVALRTQRDRLARLCAVGGAVGILWGWALAQFPFLVEPSLTIYDAAPAATLRLLTGSLAAGSLLLFPLLYYLYRLFKGRFLVGS